MKVTDVVWQVCDCRSQWPIKSFVKIDVVYQTVPEVMKVEEEVCPDCVARLEKKLEVK